MNNTWSHSMNNNCCICGLETFKEERTEPLLIKAACYCGAFTHDGTSVLLIAHKACLTAEDVDTFLDEFIEKNRNRLVYITDKRRLKEKEEQSENDK